MDYKIRMRISALPLRKLEIKKGGGNSLDKGAIGPTVSRRRRDDSDWSEDTLPV
jgi:hypothetical protein